MATAIVPGHRKWSVTRDSDGHREYKLTLRIKGSTRDGPANVLNTPGTPLPGASWQVDDDTDPWAFCRQQVSVTPIIEGEPNKQWDAEYTFSTKGDSKHCRELQFDDPLSQPPRISGTFTKYQEEATIDRFGRPITTSSWEQIRGPTVEFDKNRPSVRIEINVLNFAVIALVKAMIDHVNSAPMWGFETRCIKLSSAPWEKKYYGQCYPYYTITLDFEVMENTFDRDITDEGTKVLHGHWGDDGSWVLDNIGGLAIPSKPSLTGVAGVPTIPAGVMSYRIAARSANGSTLAGTAAQITIAAPGVSSINLTWPAVPGAISYDVYSGMAGAEKLATNVPTNSWIDATGSQVIPAVNLPTEDKSGEGPPNPFNPQHFDRFKDRNGENCRVILDGGGLPAGVITRDHYQYVCIENRAQGIPLSNDSVWTPIVGSSTPQPWNNDKNYVVGNLVTFAGSTWICLIPNTATSPGNTAHWKELTEGLNDKGVFSNTFTYSLGDYVIIAPEMGKIHVEKYDEADFFILGIPAIL